MTDLNINLTPDLTEEYWKTAEALRDLNRYYAQTAKAVRMANKQLLKFDELNRLVAPPEDTVKVSARRSSSGGSKGGSSTSPENGKGSDKEVKGPEATLPICFTIKDVLFNWDDLNWEQIAMKALAGFLTLGGGIIGGLVGGVPGALIGVAAGLLLGLDLDSLIFNFDGKLDMEELRDTVLAALPVVGGIAGFVVAGPLGAALGLTLGLLLSLQVWDFDFSDIVSTLTTFFKDLEDYWDVRWASFRRLIGERFSGLKSWWQSLSLGSFPFRTPHLSVQWQELSADSVLARFLGITAIPHLSVQWYARGGIVDGATLIGAGEAGKEAIIPLERNTEWIRKVAAELRVQLEAAPLPISILPPAAMQESASSPDFSRIADTFAAALEALGGQAQTEPEIRVYLDGKQLADAVTRYQRRSARSYGG